MIRETRRSPLSVIVDLVFQSLVLSRTASRSSRGKEQQIHDLRETSSCDVTTARKVGIIADLAMIDHLLELNGEGHQAGDARRLFRGDRLHRTRRWHHARPGSLDPGWARIGVSRVNGG